MAFKKWCVTAVLALLIAGCGGGGGGGKSDPDASLLKWDQGNWDEVEWASEK